MGVNREDPSNRTLDRRVIGGTGWMILVKVCIRSIGMLSTLILARLLLPEDFGLIAMSMSVVALVELMKAFSFDIVLIQKQDAGRTHFDTVWTLNLLFSLLMGIILFALSQPTATFYGEDRLTALVQILAISVALGGLENVGVVMFRKELEFQKEFWFRVSKKIASFLVTVTLAFIWGNYWALLAGMVSGTAVSICMSYIMQPYRPRPSLSAAREMLSFSIWLFINNLLLFAREKAAHFVVGRIAGARILGVLTISTDVSQLMTSELVQPINRAVFPGYSRLNDSITAMRGAYLNVLSAVSLFVIPAGVGIAIVAPELVPIALGDKWLDAVVPVQLLSIYGVLVAIQGNNGVIFLALGKPRILTWLATLSVLITLPILIYSTYRGGLVGACYGLLTAVLLMMPPNYYAIRKALDLQFRDVLRVLTRPFVSALAMSVACIALREFVGASSRLDQALLLVLTAITGALVYAGTAYALWRRAGSPAGAEKFALDRIRAWKAGAS